ncbi:rhamnulokinase [Serratia inhibens]|uniref:Rhamnulokinase n=1 Tax=Serratia inhibens TaxID=2338073 RepID=A0AA93BZN6_9GAMM|nr:rhamnulokinase [Serratia inhibens]RJF57971.1 rhamnulokinase [Serratia inhibens]
MTLRNIVSVDLGASSGRVMLGCYRPDSRQITLHEVTRFSNGLTPIDGHDCWDIEALERAIRQGLRQLDEQGITPDSIGIDAWGVDYLLLDAEGRRVGLPVAYRDGRTHGLMQQAQREIGAGRLYQRTGIQFLPFNTLYQLRAFSRRHPELVPHVAHALLIPDYLHYRLTGQLNWEYTNATTTQLLNIHSGEWDEELLAWAGAKAAWFGRPTAPGNTVGHWRTARGARVPVIAVASHDTASAVLATPLQDEHAAYLSSGTWSLMGFESRQPYTDAAALAANVTNEGGAEGRYRVLKNIMGLWLLQRVCDELNIADLCRLIEDAAAQPGCRSLIHPNAPRFINPPGMVREIQDACIEQGMPAPQTPAALARCIFDSLALSYRQVLGELQSLRGQPFSRLHIVGGGSQNPLLNQLCANACGIPLSAGPTEASTLGNVGSQLIALGEVADVATFRRVLAANFPQQIFSPQPTGPLAAGWLRFQTLTPSTKEFCL